MHSMVTSLALSVMLLVGTSFGVHGDTSHVTPSEGGALKTESVETKIDNVITADSVSYRISEDIDFPQAENPSMKPWMDFRTVTDTSTRNWKILHDESVKFTNDGFIKSKGCFCVAMGQNFGSAGDCFLITLSDEEGERKIPVIMADEKKYEDTVGGDGWLGSGGHVIEIVVESDALDNMVKKMGDANYSSVFHGSVTRVQKLTRISE